ncbi:hypothetical protein [Nostoc sp. FACHB-110]|uniref:hypothetical protein n=1 Tax=Nostoc sp. FACHB-110 TaxID=2692834 RepID=UPI001683581A|nr:hypothetical protein [Nostoc sp. FACHB-110]MBD2441164.1 hypothetical protein [Nostoc sp. FACHB-110]
MNSRIILISALVTLNACSNAISPIVGTWLSEDNVDEFIIAKQADKFQVSFSSRGENQGIYPAEATEKQITFNINLGFLNGHYNCSLTTVDEMDCNLTANTLLASQTQSVKLIRKK